MGTLNLHDSLSRIVPSITTNLHNLLLN